MIKDLIKALKLEKKKHRKGEKPNLLGQDQSKPQFFSPSRIQATKAGKRQAQQELKKTARRKKKEQTRLRKESTEARKAIKSQKKVANRIIPTVGGGGS